MKCRRITLQIPMAFYALVNLAFFSLELVWLALGRPFSNHLGEEAMAQHVDKRKMAKIE